MLAHLQVNFTFPSVILEHSSLIIDVTCQSGALSVAFSSEQASQSAIGYWTSNPPVQLVTHSAGCGDLATGGRAYYLAESVRLVGSTIIVSGHQVGIEEAIVDVDLVWGKNSPSQQGSNGGTSASSSSPAKGSAAGTTPPSTSNGYGFGTASSGDITTQSAQSSAYGTTPSPTLDSYDGGTTPSIASTDSLLPSSSNSQASDGKSPSESASPAAPTTPKSPSSPMSSSPCGILTTSVINGLPAATCGPNFDQRLDDALGYYPVDDAHLNETLANLAPGTSYNDIAKRDLFKRWSIGSVFHAVASVRFLLI